LGSSFAPGTGHDPVHRGPRRKRTRAASYEGRCEMGGVYIGGGALLVIVVIILIVVLL
jgi:hypothetical protein